MYKTIAHRLALLLALTVLAAPVSRIYAQAAGSQANIVTGCDPQPTGESYLIYILFVGAFQLA